MTLEKYNKKRNFSSTSEPKGERGKEGKDLIFVIQYHKARAKHYDFRLEWKGVLLSWAVPKGLSLDPDDKRLAVQVEDHPLDYASFQGIIPKGNYGAGSVDIYDNGTYVPVFDMDKGLKKGHLKFVLKGKKYEGEWSLVKMDEKNWLIIKSKDQYATKMKKKSSGLPFKKCDIQLAKLSNVPPKGKDWIFEIKYDGYRIISYVEKGKVRCITRGGQDYSKKFYEIANSLAEIDEDSFVVDGEVVAFDEKGKSDFGLLQERIKSKNQQINYVIFDILALNGEDLRKKTLFERKKLLKRLFSKEHNYLTLSGEVEGNGKKCFEFAKKNNLEGIIAKKKDSTYEGKRNGDWLKIKCYLRQEFVICGYTTSEKNKDLSALLLGYYNKSKLTYVGKVGTGFDEKQRKELSEKLSKIEVKNSPINIFPNEKVKANWVRPKYIAEIQYAELTHDKVLRQPSFIGLRSDKSPKLVKLEIADD